MTTATTPLKTAQAEARKLADKHGNLTPAIILRAAKPETSPLHGLFCWDDTRAAHEYRLIQAGHFIRSIKVTYEISENRTIRIRAYHNVQSEADEDEKTTGFYIGIETALSVESYREQLLKNCQRDMDAFKAKYAALSEVSGIIFAMDQFIA